MALSLHLFVFPLYPLRSRLYAKLKHGVPMTLYAKISLLDKPEQSQISRVSIGKKEPPIEDISLLQEKFIQKLYGREATWTPNPAAPGEGTAVVGGRSIRLSIEILDLPRDSRGRVRKPEQLEGLGNRKLPPGYGVTIAMRFTLPQELVQALEKMTREERNEFMISALQNRLEVSQENQ